MGTVSYSEKEKGQASDSFVAFRELLFCEYGGEYDTIFRDAIMLDLYNYYRLFYNRYYIRDILIQKNPKGNIEVLGKQIEDSVCKYIEGLSQNKVKSLLRGEKISSIYTGDSISVEGKDKKHLVIRFPGWFNSETQLRILLDKDVGSRLSADLTQGKTFLAVKDIYDKLCCKKEKEAWQTEFDVQKEEYVDCLLIERVVGFNLAMALYEGSLPLIEVKGREYEELISEIIDHILKINSPVLRILIVEIVFGYIGQAFDLKIIKTRKAALEEIDRYIGYYVEDVSLIYELGKEALSKELENRSLRNIDDIAEIGLPFSKFTILRKIRESNSSYKKYLNKDDKKELENYEDVNLLDDKIGT